MYKILREDKAMVERLEPERVKKEVGSCTHRMLCFLCKWSLHTQGHDSCSLLVGC